LRGHGHCGLNLSRGYNQTSFSTKRKSSFGGSLLKHMAFVVKVWHLYKCLKLGKDFEETKVEKVFGLCINKNGY